MRGVGGGLVGLAERRRRWGDRRGGKGGDFEGMEGVCDALQLVKKISK